jgi:hypothetical protein
MSPELERRLVEALVSIDWARDLNSISCRVVQRLCDCSLEQAQVIVQGVVDRGLIEQFGGNPTIGAPLDSFRLKWVKRAGSS